MNDYMRALHKRFFREPEGTEEKLEMERAEQGLKANLGREQRKRLLDLINAQSLYQEKLSLLSFIAGFRLGLGIAGEVEPYSFDDEEEERVRQKLKVETLIKQNTDERR